MTEPEITVAVRTVEQRGILLPWERWTHPPVYVEGRNVTPERPDPPERAEGGEVWIPLDTLYDLNEQGPWDSQFRSAFLLGAHEGYALEMAGLATRETRGGFHGTDKLTKFIEELEKSA